MKIVITLILMMTTILVAETANSNIKNFGKDVIGNYTPRYSSMKFGANMIMFFDNAAGKISLGKLGRYHVDSVKEYDLVDIAKNEKMKSLDDKKIHGRYEVKQYNNESLMFIDTMFGRVWSCRFSSESGTMDVWKCIDL